MMSRSDTKKWLNEIIANSSLGQRMLYRLDLNNLRHTYYLITPNETMFETVDEVPNYTAQVISVLNDALSQLRLGVFLVKVHFLIYNSNVVYSLRTKNYAYCLIYKKPSKIFVDIFFFFLQPSYPQRVYSGN